MCCWASWNCFYHLFILSFYFFAFLVPPPFLIFYILRRWKLQGIWLRAKKEWWRPRVLKDVCIVQKCFRKGEYSIIKRNAKPMLHFLMAVKWKWWTARFVTVVNVVIKAEEIAFFITQLNVGKGSKQHQHIHPQSHSLNFFVKVVH